MGKAGRALGGQWDWGKRIRGTRGGDHLDAAFDRAFITVADDGEIVVSDALHTDARATLGLSHLLRMCGLTDNHRAYFAPDSFLWTV